MITTVTLNPCNDKTVVIPHFIYGGMNRVLRQRLDLAGKGFNVARCVARLQEEAVATGILYEENGSATQMCLEGENVQTDCVWLPGSIRTNLKIFDEKEATVTEINEAGSSVSPEDLKQVGKKIEEWARQSDYLVLSGSLPPGAPGDTYARIIARCKPHCLVMLDAEGESLLRGIGGKPYLVKPNRYELEMLVDMALPTLAFVKDAALSLIRAGVEIAVVSLGEEGALITDGEESYYAPPVTGITVQGTVGAGDSMLAGVVVGLMQKKPLSEIFRMGVAAATSCVVQEGTGLMEPDEMQVFLSQVELQKL